MGVSFIRYLREINSEDETERRQFRYCGITHLKLPQMNAQSFRSRFQQRALSNASKDDFVFKAVIGDGNFGLIYLATHNPDRREYAVKSFDKENLVRSGNVDNAYREKQLLMSLSNPFVISCDYYFEDNARIYLATPYMLGGDLYAYIMWSGQPPSENAAKFYAAQVVLALEYLHSLKILHRDIKPENLMLDERGYAKLIDFGFSSVFKNINYTICGTIQYMAPEMLLGSGYGRSVDYWSLGILIHELCAFELPFDEKDHASLTRSIIDGKYSTKKEFSSSLVDLLSHLLDVNPLARYGCRQDGVIPLKNHPWFTPIDFDRLYSRSVAPPNIRVSKKAVTYQPFQPPRDSGYTKYFKEFDSF